MQKRPLGSLGEFPVLGFGGASISGEGKGYGFGLIDDKNAMDLLSRSFDAGIRIFDTAPVYGFGLSEQRLGKAFRHRRDDVFLTSKSGVTWDREKRTAVDNHPDNTQKMLHQSLRDLQTDRIDLYFIHWPDPNVDIRKPMERLARAKEDGKILAIGLSNTYPEDLQKAQEIAPVDVIQGELNLFKTYPRDALFETIRQHKLGFMSYGTLEKGILSGSVTPERVFDDPTDVRAHAPWWTHTDHTPKFNTMKQLTPLLKDNGFTPLQLALGFVLQYPESSCALCGFKTTRQLEGLLQALEQLPPSDLIDECQRIAQKNGAQSN